MHGSLLEERNLNYSKRGREGGREGERGGRERERERDSFTRLIHVLIIMGTLQ